MEVIVSILNMLEATNRKKKLYLRPTIYEPPLGFYSNSCIRLSLVLVSQAHPAIAHENANTKLPKKMCVSVT